MPIPAKLARALQQALGAEATEEFASMMEMRDATHLELRADLAELRQEMRVGFARVDTKFAELRGEVGDRIEARYSDVLKWTIVMWVTVLLSIFGTGAAIVGVLR